MAESVITPAGLPRYVQIIGESEVVLIGVRCPLQVVRERESLRTDRYNGPLELNLTGFDQVNARAYELEVDTSIETHRDLGRPDLGPPSPLALRTPPVPASLARLIAVRR